MQGRPEDIAFDATYCAAGCAASDDDSCTARRVGSANSLDRRWLSWSSRQDLQRKVRVRRTANLVLFVVDASWSMAAAERMEATKGAILSLLHDAYQRRDQVGLVVFQREEARIVLPPTSSVELAQHALAGYPGRREDPAVGRPVGRLPGLHGRAAPRSRSDAADHHPHRWRRQRLGHRPAAAGRGRTGGRPDPPEAICARS